MTVFEDLRYEAQDGVAVIRLNRPEALNAFTPAMGVSLKNAIGAAVADAAVRVIVLTGAGACAGRFRNRLRKRPGSGRFGPLRRAFRLHAEGAKADHRRARWP